MKNLFALILATSISLFHIPGSNAQTHFSKDNAERAFTHAQSYAFETIQGSWLLVGYVDIRVENIGRYKETGLRNNDQSYHSMDFTKETVEDFFDGTIIKQLVRLKNLGAFRADQGPLDVKIGEQGILFALPASGSAGAFFDYECREINNKKLICSLTLRLLHPENAYENDRLFKDKIAIYAGFIRK